MGFLVKHEDGQIEGIENLLFPFFDLGQGEMDSANDV